MKPPIAPSPEPRISTSSGGWACAFLLLSLSGCASVDYTRPPLWLQPKVHAGHVFARRNCATCHAVEQGARSPDRRATPFEDIARYYDDAGLASELEAIGRMGHFQMPARAIAERDRLALAAYLAHLRDRPEAPPR